jgi:hypothetical protein
MIRHWGEIQAWRRRLERWQGVRFNGAVHYLANLKSWHQAWRRGRKAEPSLAELARWVNKEIAITLEEVYSTIRDSYGDAPPIPFERLLEYPSWRLPRGHWSAELAYPVMLMEWWGLPRADIHDWCQQAVENLKGGKSAFDRPDEPISRERIWAKLKRLDPDR